MECTEQTLEDMLASPHGRNCGQWILDWIISGNRFTITLKDGSVLVLSEHAAAEKVLTGQFGWRPPS
jgi:hypothetical protein